MAIHQIAPFRETKPAKHRSLTGVFRASGIRAASGGVHDSSRPRSAHVAGSARFPDSTVRVFPGADRQTGRPAGFGPWLPGLPEIERTARLRSLRTLVRLLAPSEAKFLAALRLAETDPAALEQAYSLLLAVPALTQRRILSTYAELHRPRLSADQPCCEQAQSSYD